MAAGRRLKSMVLVPLVGVLGLWRALHVAGVPLDSSYVSLRYAQGLGTGRGMSLEGQTVAVEGFTDPLWVLLLGGLRSVGVHEAKLQLYLGPALMMILLAALTAVVLMKHRTVAALVPVLIFGAWAPLGAAAGSGTDSLWLAVIGFTAVIWIGTDIEEKALRKRSMIALALLVSTGLPGLLIGLLFVALSGPVLRRRMFLVTGGVFLAWTFWRFAVFGSVWPRALAVRMSTLSFDTLQDAFILAPVLCVLGLAGLLLCRGRGCHARLVTCALTVWMAWTCTGAAEINAFHDGLIPAFALIVLLGAGALAAQKGRMLILCSAVTVAAGIGLDVRTAEASWPEVRELRMGEVKRAQGMARFIRWRFEPEERVAVQTPGAVPYHARRPVIDLSGVTETEDLGPLSLLARSPSAILPEGHLVSTRPRRLLLAPQYREPIGRDYKQYAIPHQKKWKLVRAHPVWFHIYIRGDLPMLRPDISKEEGNQFPTSVKEEGSGSSSL